MAKIGLSKPYYAKYSETDHTYSDGGLLGKAVSMTITPDDASDNKLYADNGIAENEVTISGGELTIVVDDLSPDVIHDAWGVPSETISTPITGTVLTYGNNQEIPYLGIGGVVKRRKSGTTSYVGVVITKCKLKNPVDELATQEEEIEWGTQEIEGTFMRDDTTNEVWKKICYCSTEADAVTWVKAQLNIT